MARLDTPRPPATTASGLTEQLDTYTVHEMPEPFPLPRSPEAAAEHMGYAVAAWMDRRPGLTGNDLRAWLAAYFKREGGQDAQ